MQRLSHLLGIVLIALGTLLLAPTLFGQMHESVTVEIVDVPVYVFNDSGPIRNLTKSDFELFVNGTRQQIDYFDIIDFAVSPSNAMTVRDVRERRLFLLVFDLAFTRPAAIDRARKAAAAMIDGASPTDYFAVATYTYRHGVYFLVPFTNDHTVARRAAMQLSAGFVRDPLGLAISQGERTAFTVDPSAVARVGQDEVRIDPVLARLEALTADLDNGLMPMRRIIENQVTDFDTVGSRLAQLEGYKHVIVLSEGFNPMYVYADPYTADPHLIDTMAAMFASFRRANALVDTIDLGHPGRNTILNDALHYMARETGGQFIQHQNDLKLALERISSASASGYRLGFRLPPNAKRGDNTIDVKVHNVPRGTTLYFRRGFSTTKAVVSSFDGLHLADIILNDIPQTGIAPRIAFRAQHYVDIDVPAEAVDGGDAEVLLYIFDARGSVVEFKQKHFASAGSLRTKLELPSGTYVAKALLRSGDSVGFTRQEFTIP